MDMKNSMSLSLVHRIEVMVNIFKIQRWIQDETMELNENAVEFN